MWTPIEKWQCGECGELHSDEYDAKECCRPVIREVYICPICSEKHGEHDAALECIAKCETEDTTSAYMASKAELERQGQERLF